MTERFRNGGANWWIAEPNRDRSEDRVSIPTSRHIKLDCVEHRLFCPSTQHRSRASGSSIPQRCVLL